MATRLFTYGSPKMVIKQNEWLPGRFATAWGVNVNGTGVKASNLDIEYGEILKITAGGLGANADYVCERVAALTTKMGVVLRTTDGQINMEEGMIERPRSANALSIYPLDSSNAFTVAVPIIAAQSVTVGAQVYVCIVDGSEGAVQATNANSALTLTGWVFASAPYQPTKGAGLAVLIKRA